MKENQVLEVSTLPSSSSTKNPGKTSQGDCANENKDNQERLDLPNFKIKKVLTFGSFKLSFSFSANRLHRNLVFDLLSHDLSLEERISKENSTETVVFKIYKIF